MVQAHQVIIVVYYKEQLNEKNITIERRILKVERQNILSENNVWNRIFVIMIYQGKYEITVRVDHHVHILSGHRNMECMYEYV